MGRTSPPAATPSLEAPLVARVVALAKSGCYVDMELLANELVAAHPNSGFAWKALGVSRQMQGKNALEALERAAELLPNDADCHSNLGSALRQRGRMADAAASYQRALALKPTMAEIWNNLGNVHKELGRFDDAFTAYHKALELKPGFAPAHNNLGNALQLIGKLEKAAASYTEAIKLEAGYADAHVNLGIVLRLQNRTAAALEACQEALERNPGLAAAWQLRAELHSDQGEFGAAEQSLKRALAIEPDSPEAWAGIAGLRRMTLDDRAWMEQARRIAEQSTAPREVCLRYALGKYFDDVSDYGQAFSEYRRANELAATVRPRHRRDAVASGVSGIISEYNRAWLREVKPGNPSERPVFIVGMPRSGTTLAEQILAAHPAVFGAGELSYWNTAFETAHSTRSAEAKFDANSPRALADAYLAELNTFSANALRLVDKMPGNFLYLGLVHAALPRARIIHMRRDPIDTCLSIYFQNFGAVHPYANDLDDLAHYYREYSRIMEHWRTLLPPEALLEVPYESLAHDPELWSRRLVEFVGIPWDAGCLDFHQNARAVNTFSKWQARQRISASSVARWRNYESFVGPLRSLSNDGRERYEA